MVYFTADLHLGHAGIISRKNRPFSSVEEMNRTLVTNYNAVVRNSDTVYLLGDLCHKMPPTEADAILRRLNGKKYLIRGNHDKEYDPSIFEEVRDLMTLSLSGVYFVLMHYPMLSWQKMHSGSIHLHGHMHASKEYNENNFLEGIRRYDVGVDANDYFPVSLPTILEFFGLHAPTVR